MDANGCCSPSPQIPEYDQCQAHALPRKRHRASTACATCRLRKVRCDVQHRLPCTNCILDEVPCRANPPRRTRKPKTNDFGLVVTNHSVREPSSSETSSLSLVSDPAFVTCLRPPSTNYRSQVQNEVNYPFISQDFRRYLVQCYLHHVHPRLPVMTVRDLINIADIPDGQSPSCGRFVLSAFFAASMQFVDPAILRDFHIQSWPSLFDICLSKAKELYHIEVAEQKYTAIQGLLLMSFCAGHSSYRDNFFWLGLAHTVAVANRLDSESSHILQPEKGLRKRLWWTLFSQIRLISLTTNAKPYVNMCYTAVSPLNANDFEYCFPGEAPQEMRKLDLLPSPCSWLAIGKQFLRRLELLQLYSECFTWPDFCVKSPILATNTARLICSTQTISISRKSTNAQEVEDLDGLFSSSCPGREKPTFQQLPTPHFDIESVLLDMERFLFNSPCYSDE